MRTYYSLYSRLLSKQALYDSLRQAKRNKGEARINGQNLKAELSCLLTELREKRYHRW